MREIEILEKKKIILPNNFEPDLGDIVTGFFKDATPGVSANSEL